MPEQPAPWADDRLTQAGFARARFKDARKRMAALWGHVLEVSETGHHPAAAEGQLLALEIGDLLLSTLDLGTGAIGWRFAARGGGTPLLMVRAIRGAELVLDAAGLAPHALPAGQIALIPLTGTATLTLPEGGRCDIGILSAAPDPFPRFALLEGNLASGQHLAFVAGYMLRCAPHPPGRARELRQAFGLALAHVAADLASHHRQTGETAFERFKFLVAANLGRADLALSDIATAMGTSPRQLQRMLRAEGTTFRGHLQGSRLMLARQMIQTSQIRPRVADLAYRCGFSDPNYFSRAYTQFWKTPPSQG
ncbi:MAG: helix-turn-helix transcriptional regulator [Paracoccaceae bacterium]